MAAGDIYTRSAKHDPKKATVFDGVDDYSEIDAWAVAVKAHTVGTISGWINICDPTAAYVLASIGDWNVDDSCILAVSAGKVTGQLVNGGVDQWIIAEDVASITTDKWHYIALVQNGDKPKLYINGLLATTTTSVTTDTTAWFASLGAGLDVGAIGARVKNATIAFDMKGGIGPVKHWNLALNADEIFDDFAGNTIGIRTEDATRRAAVVAAQVSSWDMDGLTDKWTTYDMTLTNQAYLDGKYTTMNSKLKAISTVVADDMSTSTDGTNTYAVVVKAA